MIIANRQEVRRPRLRRRVWDGLWYFGLTIVSVGLLAVVPFAHAARRVRRRGLRVWTAVYGAIDVALVLSLALIPAGTPQVPAPGWAQAITTIGGFLMLATTVVGCIQLRRVRREVYGWPKRHAAELPAAPEPAVAAVLAARTRRQEARELATSDPLLARDLHIGRPDLPRTYDDGGLVDLNNAPAEVIARECELDPATADRIVSTRNRLGGAVSNVDELFVLAELPVTSWDRIRDRAVLLPN
ncbi:MAG TPA: hypothetical protein VGD48_07040 [Kutzneria sp.]|jgi:hypothetical protein